MTLLQKHRPHGVYVTDLSSQLWCEKQLAYSIELGRIRTKEMKKGQQRHQELHEEVVDLVRVKPTSFEDRVSLKLHNMLTAIKSLIEDGMARELPVYGFVNTLFTTGVIDELRLEDNRLILEDTKTRRKDTMPTQAQQKTTRFQIMIYKHLIDQAIKGEFTPQQLIQTLKFNEDTEITNDFKTQLTKLGLLEESNIKRLADKVFNEFKKLPITHNQFEIRYEEQHTKKLIGTIKFEHNPNEFKENSDFVEGFWNEKRSAIPVGKGGKWKCSFCQYKKQCFTNFLHS